MTQMRYRRLGQSGINVSELCLGTMMFGAETAEAEAGRIMGHALDNGVNFIDTANTYTQGRSEETIGRLMQGNRERWVLATKVSNVIGKGANDRGLSRYHVTRSVETSLKRLQTDHIDLFYIHKLDPTTSWENIVLTFGDLIRQGKIREWGLSNVRAWHIAHVGHLCRQLGVPQPTALQPYYNLLNRQPEEELIPAASAFGQGVVPYSPIARGVLSGKYKLNQAAEPGSRAARKDRRMMETEWRPESLEIAEKLKAHAENRSATLVHWATAWVLNNRAISSIIAGPRTFEQWTSYFGALDYKWTKEDEQIANSLVPSGHASTPHYSDPQYTVEGRFATIGA
jgi:aryl-alcohol dehydrogenase-like predicted oxidoreductase